MNKRLLDILCCPASKVPVAPMDKSQLDALNSAIERGQVTTVADVPVKQPLQTGLITADGKLIYRVEDDIPIMLTEEAIAAVQLDRFPGAA